MSQVSFTLSAQLPMQMRVQRKRSTVRWLDHLDPVQLLSEATAGTAPRV